MIHQGAAPDSELIVASSGYCYGLAGAASIYVRRSEDPTDVKSAGPMSSWAES